MQWIAPSEKDKANDALEKRLWQAADQLRANSGLTAQQYSGPILGLIFLRFAEVRFAKRRAELEKQTAGARRGSRVDDAKAYTAKASSTSRRTRASISSSACRKARTSARS